MKKTGAFISIDFGQLFVKISYLKSLKSEEFRLINYDLKKIPPEENRNEKIAEFINDFLKTNSITIKEAYLTISDPDSIIIKQVVLPPLPKEEVLEAIKWQFKDEISFDLKNFAADWRVVKEFTDSEGVKKNEVIFCMVRNEIIERYLSIINLCRLSPVVLTIGPFNYTNILSCLDREQKTKALLDIGSQESTLCIYKDNKLNFVRRISFSSEKLTQSLTNTLASDKGKIMLSYEQAQNLRLTYGIPKEENAMLENNIQAVFVIQLMRPYLESLVRELKSSFEYFSSNLKEEQPQVLYLTGGGANLKNLDWYLNKELNLNVSNLSIPDCISTEGVDKERLSRDQNQIINSLGAISSGPDTINFISSHLKRQKIKQTISGFVRVAAFAIAVILLFSLLSINSEKRNYKIRQKNALMYLKNMEEIRSWEDKLGPYEEIIDRIEMGKVPLDGLLKTIGNLLPGNVILNEINFDQETRTLILTGTISAYNLKPELVLSKAIEKISASSFLLKAELVSSVKGKDSLQFVIKCELAH